MQEYKKETEPSKFVDFEIQKEHLLNGSYEYELLLIDSMNSKGVTYECKGKITDGIKNKDEGVCTSPAFISYTLDTKKTVMNQIDTTYIEIDNIFFPSL